MVFGRKTLETFPGQRLLPNRVNVILSRNFDFEKEGAVILHSVDELQDFLALTADEVYLIGGASMYNSLIGLCDKAIITSIRAEYEADCYFPDLDKDPDWELEFEEDPVMTDELRAFIDKDREELLGDFCRGCGYCMPCTMDITINQCARMSLMLRRAPSKVWLSEHWKEEMLKVETCVDCGICKTRCPYELDIPTLLRKNLKNYKEILDGKPV